MVTNETEQGRQYKEYTREATGNKAERSAQLLGGESSWTSQAAKPSAGTNSAVLRQAKRQVDYHNPFGRRPQCCLFLYLFFPVDFLEARESLAVPFYLLEEHLLRTNPVFVVAVESLIDYHPFLCL